MAWDYTNRRRSRGFADDLSDGGVQRYSDAGMSPDHDGVARTIRGAESLALFANGTRVVMRPEGGTLTAPHSGTRLVRRPPMPEEG